METNGYLGSLLIKGIENKSEDSEDEDEDEIESSTLTEKQLDSLCYIMITKGREKDLEAMEKLILGDQYDDSVQMFNTRFSYDVMQSWDFVSEKYSKLKKPARKFDLLFAYTFQLKSHDYWMHDNEGGMEVLTEELAEAWKDLLKNSDEALEIDVNYTKPAIGEMLGQFKEKVESVEFGYYPQLKFDYK